MIDMNYYGPGAAAAGRPPVYNVQLFDDLHYYLPEILYNNSRFRTLPDLFAYINDSMRQHFDRYSAAQAAASRAQAQAQEQAPSRLYYYMPIPNTLNILAELLNGGGQPPAAPPHPLGATEADLTRGTRVGVVAQQVADRVCSICHDAMDVGATVRIISHCRHMFHRTCIDYWLGRSTQCPVCRHDIAGVPAAESESDSE
jgi:hypothetical protein